MRRPPMSPRVFPAWLLRAGPKTRRRRGWPGTTRRSLRLVLLSLPERENRHLADSTGGGAAAAASRVRHGTAQPRRGPRPRGRPYGADRPPEEVSAGAAFARSLGLPRLTGTFSVLRLRSIRRATWPPCGKRQRPRHRLFAGVLGGADRGTPARAGRRTARGRGGRAACGRGGAAGLGRARVQEADQRLADQGLALLQRRRPGAADRRAGGDHRARGRSAGAGLGRPGLTVVARPHRGHRLGLLVKVAMLELLAAHEPRLERIVTATPTSTST